MNKHDLFKTLKTIDPRAARKCVVCGTPSQDGSATCSPRCWGATMRVRVRGMLAMLRDTEEDACLPPGYRQ